MKKPLLIIIVLLLVAGGVFGYLISNASSLVARYKPNIEQAASEALGTRVELGDLDLSIFPKTAIRVQGASIGGLPEDGEGFQLGELLLECNLFALLSGNIHITTLRVVEPHVKLIKDAKGVRLAGMPAKDSSERLDNKEVKKRADSSVDIPSEEEESSEAKEAAELPFTLELDSLRVEGGKITLEDLNEEAVYTISAIDLAAGLAIDGKQLVLRNMELSANLLERMTLAKRAERVSYNLKDQNLTIRGLRSSFGQSTIASSGFVNIASNTGQLELAESPLLLTDLVALASPFAPELDKLALKGEITPSFKITLSRGAIKSGSASMLLNGLSAIIEDFKISQGNCPLLATAMEGQFQLAGEQCSVAINDAPLEYSLRARSEGETKVRLLSFQTKLLGGSLDLSGEYELAGEQPFEMDLKSQGIQIAQALKMLEPNKEPGISGTVRKLNAQLTGNIKDDPLPTLAGPISIEVVDTSLRGVNVAASVLSAVKDLPFVSDALYGELSPEQQAALQSPDTSIKELVGNFTLKSKQLTTNNLRVIAPLFSLAGRGTIGLEGALNLNAELSFTPEMSEALASRVREIRNMLNKEGRLVVPLTIKGQAPKISVSPDTSKLLKAGARATIEKEAGKLLDKTLKERGLGGLFGR